MSLTPVAFIPKFMTIDVMCKKSRVATALVKSAYQRGAKNISIIGWDTGGQETNVKFYTRESVGNEPICYIYYTPPEPNRKNPYFSFFVKLINNILGYFQP